MARGLVSLALEARRAGPRQRARPLAAAVPVAAPAAVPAAAANLRSFRMMRLVPTSWLAAFLTGWLIVGPVAPPATAAQGSIATAQMTFASPDEAAAALVEAVKQSDPKRMLALLGPGSEALISSGDPNADAANRQKFVADYEAKHRLSEISPGRDILIVGADEWPLPIPVVRVRDHWQFDSRAGAQQIVDRRIGRNEIAAIRVALTYADAQRDYFERSKQASGVGEFAQRLVSTSDQRDGLFW